MTTCCIPGCDNDISHRSRLRTCPSCRASLHSWEKRRPAEILQRAQNLNKYRARMATFAVVKDDDVTKVDHAVLEQKRLMTFRNTRKRAKSNVVEFKLREIKRRKVAS